MFSRRTSFNPKRAVDPAPAESDIKRWESKVRYGGNPEHKKNPGDFGLTPPSSPRAYKTLCDLAGIMTRREAVSLLKQGIRRKLVSQQRRNGFPQNIWSVTKAGVPLEAMLENAGDGTYHGFPMPVSDPFRERVLELWNRK